MIQINISALPWQEFSVVLDGQNCVISLRQVADHMYCNLTCEEVEIFKGRKVCVGTDINTYGNGQRSLDYIVNFLIRQLPGKLRMIDTLGNSDPQYEGLNDRWILVYASENEVLNGAQ